MSAISWLVDSAFHPLIERAFQLGIIPSDVLDRCRYIRSILMSDEQVTDEKVSRFSRKKLAIGGRLSRILGYDTR